MSKLTINIPYAYSASQWLFAHGLAKYMNDKGYPAVVTSMGTGVGDVLFVGNSEGLEGNRYSVRERHVSASSPYAFERALEELIGLLDGGNTLDGIELSGDAAESFEEPTVYTLERSGDVRIMFCNVFNHIYKFDKINTPNLTSGPIPLRHLMEKEIFEAYLPDVLCLQEYQRWFREGWEGSPTMTSHLEAIGYVEAVAKTQDDLPNAVPVFYLPDKLELEACGHLLYDGHELHGDKTKSVTWARFTVKQSGKRFIAMSTHYMWNSPKFTKEQGAEFRKSNSRQALELIATMEEGVPVIFGGDLNCNSREEEWHMLEDSGLTYAKTAAERFNKSAGCKRYAKYDSDTNTHVEIIIPNEGNGIDHVFYKGNVRVNTFMTVTDRLALLSTDHCPKFADIVL